MRSDENTLELDDASIRRLESLGYLARGSNAIELRFEQGKDDPKDWIEFYGDDQQATELVHERDYDQARPLAERSLTAGLIKLEEEGRAQRDGAGWRTRR